jgi:hypothetical protein
VVIVGSLLLILVAVATLGLGLVQGSNALLVGSIAASMLAAIALIVGARRTAAARAVLDDNAYDGLGDERAAAGRRADPPRGSARRGDGTVYGRESAAHAAEPGDLLVEDDPDLVSVPHQTSGEPHQTVDEPDRVLGDPDQTLGDRNRTLDEDVGYVEPGVVELDLDLDEDLDDEDPPDEPAAQLVPAADAARVARMSTNVLVIDGRPRYHQPGCVHLLGRESEALPVSEAVQLGFTPCSLCEPDSALLAEARRA